MHFSLNSKLLNYHSPSNSRVQKGEDDPLFVFLVYLAAGRSLLGGPTASPNVRVRMGKYMAFTDISIEMAPRKRTKIRMVLSEDCLP